MRSTEIKRKRSNTKERSRMTESLAYFTRAVEPVVYRMFKSQEKEREMKAE
jgi:hypothetical protein